MIGSRDTAVIIFAQLFAKKPDANIEQLVAKAYEAAAMFDSLSIDYETNRRREAVADARRELKEKLDAGKL